MRFKFQNNVNSRDILLDFEIPGEKEKEVKKEFVSIPEKYLEPIIIPEKGLPKKAKIYKYPIPYHFWAYDSFLRNKHVQDFIDKNRKETLSPHFIAFHRHFGSNIGTKILKYTCPKITPLWISEITRKKIVRRSYLKGRIVRKLVGPRKFLLADKSRINNNYITIEKVYDEEENGTTVFDVRKFL